MQVRKFEAKSIREAIDMVKFEMGPDAVILSAKENSISFGLMGESSVEVTAAVSESKLRKKQFAEKKLDSRTRHKYQHSTAKVQRQFIEKAFTDSETDSRIEREAAEKIAAMPPPPPKRNGITAVRYADIYEDGEAAPAPKAQVPVPAPKSQAPVMASAITTYTASTTTRPGAVNPASDATSAATMSSAPALTASTPSNAVEKIKVLQSEVRYLRELLDKFQKVPQNIIALHPGAEEGLPFELSFAFQRLQNAGIASEHIVHILKLAHQILPAEQKKKKALVDGWVIKYFLDQIRVQEKPFSAKYQIFLGPTGQGKTSTVVKLACHMMLKAKKKIALLTGDTIKVGAADQVKIYGQILNVPIGVINSARDWAALEPALKNVDYVFVDTPGVNLRGVNELDLLRSIMPPGTAEVQKHYVQSVLARDVDAFEVAERFKAIGFHDVIFTRLDEAVQYGMIYNFQKHFDVPLHSFGIGNSIPEDFEMASKERVIDLIFNLSNFRKERGTP